MNKLQLALSLIRPSAGAKLTDRAFGVTVVFSALAWLAAFFNKIPFEQAIELTKYTVGPYAVANYAKDAILGHAALKDSGPDTVNAGTVVNKTSAEEAAPTQYDQFVPNEVRSSVSEVAGEEDE